MKKLNTKGFGTVEVLLIIVLIGIIVVAGWFVWKSRQATDNNLDNASKNADSSLNATKQQSEIDHGKYNKKFSQVPAGLQQAILAVYKNNSAAAACVKNNKIYDYNGKPVDISLLYKFDAAIVGIGCEAYAAYFFGLEGNTWKKLEGTQEGFSCSVLEKYKVPISWISEKNDPSDSDMEQLPARCFRGEKYVEYKGV